MVWRTVRGKCVPGLPFMRPEVCSSFTLTQPIPATKRGWHQVCSRWIFLPTRTSVNGSCVKPTWRRRCFTRTSSGARSRRGPDPCLIGVDQRIERRRVDIALLDKHTPERPETRRSVSPIALRLAASSPSRGDTAAYSELRDRYRDMARTLGYEGHIAWAEAMPSTRRCCAAPAGPGWLRTPGSATNAVRLLRRRNRRNSSRSRCSSPVRQR